MNIPSNALSTMLLAAAIAVPLTSSVARSDEGKALRPEIAQLTESVSERIQEAADKLGLTEEQRKKLAEIRDARVDQRKALRAERRAMLQDELKSINSILTPEQQAKVKELIEDKREQAAEGPSGGLPKFVVSRDSLAERIEAAADKLMLSSEQRAQIASALASHAEQHAAAKAKRREAVEDEFKAVAAVLTPEQREKAHDALELRVRRAAAACSIADRLEAMADKLGLSAEQREHIAKAHAQFASQYRALRSERRELLGEELKQIATALTPEQRDKVKDFREDEVVVVEVRTAAQDAGHGETALRETISERLEPLGDKLALTPEQQTKIRSVRTAMADKFKAQRERRRALRAEELKALSGILTPEQREKAKSLVDERS